MNTLSPPANRHSDALLASARPAAPALAAPQVLPAVDWSAMDTEAPRAIHIDSRHAEDPLPQADILILTWTAAEWFALDHVFCNSASAGNYSTDFEWKKGWWPYTRNVVPFSAGPDAAALWGEFRMVSVSDRSGRPWRVMLFKSNAHLAHPPWIDGLTAMLRQILADARPDRIYTIGTAGGARMNQRLGDSVLTNAALLDMQRPQNSSDSEDGAMFRCASWFPATALLPTLQDRLLMPLDQVATEASLQTLFAQLQAKHPDDPAVAALQLGDLLNDVLAPSDLGSPRVHVLPDVPLLTTDFYYIARGDSTQAYAFLEMDDALIGREANRAGVRFACLRNISDPIVPFETAAGAPIVDGVRADWSGLIYSNFGLFTSFNGALATWATLVGEGRTGYNPGADTGPVTADDALEVKLAFQVRACTTCKFFWPDNKALQPYGPYTSFDIQVNTPYTATLTDSPKPQPWLKGRTRPPAFPNGEVIDGCRKAPIMTIGINPNLTAALPSQAGAAWAYPDFSSDEFTDAWAKYAWYYRYRTVYQERLSLDFVRRFVLPEGRVDAPRPGHVTAATRLSDSPAWSVKVRYDGDAADTEIALDGKLGEFPFMLLFDVYLPNNRFAAGEAIAGRIAVPPGIQVDVLQQEQGYYVRFQPALKTFEHMLHSLGHTDAQLRIGEDVAQLDMVACASPHWNANFLGGSQQSIQLIVDNCVTHNAWAIKQLVQTRPAVLYVVSESSWNMLRGALGNLVVRDPPISTRPSDKDFTLLRETTDPAHPAYLEFDVTVDGLRYQHRTRLVITPHFSYPDNFLQQLRVSPALWAQVKAAQPEFPKVLTAENGFKLVYPPAKYPDDPMVIQFPADAEAARKALATVQRFPAAWALLKDSFVDPHALMAQVLSDLYGRGEIRWTAKTDHDGKAAGYLSRNAGACNFCSNAHWQFPGECRYGKNRETQPPPGYLEKVALQVVAAGALPAVAAAATAATASAPAPSASSLAPTTPTTATSPTSPAIPPTPTTPAGGPS